MPAQSDSGSTLLTTNNETVLSTITTVGLYEFAIDLNPLTGGTTPDVLLIYPKEKVISSSTARIVDGFPFNYVGGLVASPVAKYQILVMHSVAFAIQQTQGTLRTFDWSVRKVDNVTIETNNDKTGYRLSATGVDDIWDEATSGHSTAGTTGKALTDAGSAGDPWSTAVPGAYSSGTAGYRIGNALSNSGTVILSATGMDNVLDAANGIETGLTFRNALRAMASALAGKVSGAATTTIVFRNAVADNKNRITATVDTDGNRSAITYDFS